MTQFDDEAKDYCKSFKLIIKEKLSFINQLQSIENMDDQMAFSEKCLAHIRGLENSWFDPSIPSSIISEIDMCDSYYDVMKELHCRG